MPPHEGGRSSRDEELSTAVGGRASRSEELSSARSSARLAIRRADCPPSPPDVEAPRWPDVSRPWPDASRPSGSMSASAPGRGPSIRPVETCRGPTIRIQGWHYPPSWCGDGGLGFRIPGWCFGVWSGVGGLPVVGGVVPPHTPRKDQMQAPDGTAANPWMPVSPHNPSVPKTKTGLPPWRQPRGKS